MEDKNEPFLYTYSAQEQEEVQRIRQKYLPPAQDKLAELRRLDASVTRPGAVAALFVGIAGTLVFGAGMTCVMVWNQLFLGIGAGVAGLLLASAAYPLFRCITARRRDKLAPAILRLTDELLQ